MSVNYNEINIPINSEKRDPFYGRSKSEIGLGLVPNMSFNDVETSILANVKSTVDEGVAYNYESYASDSEPILANIVKLKPNSARTVIHFSLGTWTDKSEFISRDTATLELRSNRTNVSYNLYVTEPYPNNNSSSSTDTNLNRSTPLTSTKVIIKEFNTGGWLVSIKVVDRLIDAIWINLVESKNVDVQNPLTNIYDDSEFGRSIEFYCDKSRISTNLDIGGTSLIAKSLNHPVPIKLNSVDPDDYYNNNSSSYSLTNIDISNLIGTSGLIKDNTLVSIPILTDEDTCKKDQLIPMSVNRLNHQIKFRLSGSVHGSQRDSWKSSQTDQSNLTSFLDTDPEAINEFPLSITELTHDINVGIGVGSYYGSMPESGQTGGTGYGKYSFSGGKVNYATIQDSSNGRDEYFKYDTVSKAWQLSSGKFPTREESTSLSTKPNSMNELNLVIHGLDHDIKIEVVNSSYRTSRGIATDSNGLLGSSNKIDSGIRNLTWEEYDGIENEKRKNSYATGHISANTFEKNSYQGLDLTIHGLDHNINLEFYRVDSNAIKGPSVSDIVKSDKYRPNSGGHDILGNISIDTFTGRTQNLKLEVIDSRYSDCSRGLAIRYKDNYMPYDMIDGNGDFGSYLPTAPSSDELVDLYPTINGIPFTGDFRYKIKYPPNLERDGISKEHSARNIVIPAYHMNSSLDGSGDHDWEVLSNIRVSEYNSNGNPVSNLKSLRYQNNVSSIANGYGLTRITTIDSSATGTSQEKLKKYLNSLGNDSDSVSVKALKLIIGVTNGSSESITEDITELRESIKSTKTELKEYTNSSIKSSESKLTQEINKAKNSALHANSTLSGSGAHQWEVLSSIRVAGYNSSGSSISRLSKTSYPDSSSEYLNGYGLTRLSSIDLSSLNSNIIPSDKLSNMIDSLGSDEDAISVKVVKALFKALNERFEKLEKSADIN